MNTWFVHMSTSFFLPSNSNIKCNKRHKTETMSSVHTNTSHICFSYSLQKEMYRVCAQHGALNHLPSLVYLGENSAHQLLISPGTHYCWVYRGTMGWEVCPTILHLSNSAPFLPPWVLPPWVNHVLILALPPYLHCHHQSNMINYYLATISPNTVDVCLATSQTRLTFALPPMSRTPCPVAPNALDIQPLHLRAIYTVHCSWMNIAVCKQVSGWLTLHIVYIWNLAHSWTLYNLCDSISIFSKQMSLSHHVRWYLLMWQKIS